MQCVILCAGKGTRMRPLTDSTPKPLIEVCGKPVLQHIVEALPSDIDELILVIGYLEEQIREFCGSEFCGRSVKYVKQSDFAAGTANALWQAKDLLHGKFLHLNGDDIHGSKALQSAVKYSQSVLGSRSDTPERFGVFAPNEDGTLQSIVEKPTTPPSNLVSTGGFVFDSSIFEYYDQVDTSEPDCLVDLITLFTKDYPMAIVEQDLWLPIGYPEHIEAAEKVLCPDYVEKAD